MTSWDEEMFSFSVVDPKRPVTQPAKWASERLAKLIRFCACCLLTYLPFSLYLLHFVLQRYLPAVSCLNS